MQGADIFEPESFLELAWMDTSSRNELARESSSRRMRLTLGLAMFALASMTTLGIPRIAFSQQPSTDPWLGKRVVQKSQDFGLRIENQVVDRRRFLLFYQVEQVNGAWLWLKAEGRSLRGWARAEEVIPVEKAMEYFSERIRIKPLDAFAYMMRATLRHDKMQLSKAIDDYNEAIKLDPTHAWVFNNRGIAWSDSKDYDRALADFNEAIRLDDQNPNVYNNRGTIWRKKRVYPAAIADFNRAIQLHPQYAFAFYNRGLSWADQREYTKAIADFDEVIRIYPDDALSFYNRAIAHFYLKAYDAAIADQTVAIRLDPRNARAFYHRGLAWYEKHDFGKARADYDEAIRLAPNHAGAYYNRALVWSNQKQYNKAVSDYDKAIQINPELDEAYASRAWLYLTCPDPKYRDAKKAIDSARKACELTDWAEAYDLGALAAACAEAGDFDAAGRWQSRANELLAAGKDHEPGFRLRHH